MKGFDENARDLFERTVQSSRWVKVWTGSYANGLLDAYILMTGGDREQVMERLYEAVNEVEQKAHDEMLASQEAQELDGYE